MSFETTHSNVDNDFHPKFSLNTIIMIKVLQKLKYILPVLALVMSCKPKATKPAVGFELTIEAKNLAGQGLILSYRDTRDSIVRADLKLDEEGKYQISMDSEMAENTLCRLVIPGISDKSRDYRDYMLGTYFPFFASNGSEILIKGEVTEKPVEVIYQIVSELPMNTLLNDFNASFMETTRVYREANTEMNQLKRQRPTTETSGEDKKVRRARLNELLGVVRDNVSEMQFLENYIQENDNTLSAFFLYYLYEVRTLEDDFVSKRLNEYSVTNSKSRYATEALDLLNKRNKFAVGRPIENITSTTISGESFDLQNIKKDFVLIDFWGTWCGPCKKGMPDMKKFYDHNKGQLEIVSIACLDKEEKWQDFLGEHPEYDWVHIFDYTEKMDKKFNVEAFPTKLLLSRDGVILHKAIGEAHGDYEIMQEIITKS